MHHQSDLAVPNHHFRPAQLHPDPLKRAYPDSLDAAVVEVIVSFGHSILAVAHVDPGRGFFLGPKGEAKELVDFEIDPELLGQSRLSLIHVAPDGAVHAIIPTSARGWLRHASNTIDLDGLRPSAHLAPDGSGAVLVPLGRDIEVHYSMGALDIKLQLSPRAEALPSGLMAKMDRDIFIYFASCAATFMGLMSAMAFFTPPFGLSDDSVIDRERLFLISQYLDAASERDQERQDREANDAGNDGGAEAKRAEGREGEAGRDSAPRVNKQAAVRGPKDNPRLELSRARLLHEARTAGMIGLLTSARSELGLENPVFGRDASLGSSDVNAEGNMWGDEIGESAGRGGLGISGDGFGGGDLFGNGIGIGTGSVGTIGSGTGETGIGLSRGRPSGHHVARGPLMRTVGQTEVSGRLPPQVIQRVVRQNFGRFRMCYEQGLGRNPNLEGRVSVRFIIGNDGGVSAVSAGGDLPDQAAKSCVASAFYGISFPAPQDGIVKVTYPLMFSPQ